MIFIIYLPFYFNIYFLIRGVNPKTIVKFNILDYINYTAFKKIIGLVLYLIIYKVFKKSR